jgi:hypothetical protein
VLKKLMHFLLKVYTVDNESALSKYIPFAATKIVQYDDYSIPSELHDPILISLDRLKVKVLFYALCITLNWLIIASAYFGNSVIVHLTDSRLYTNFSLSFCDERSI